MKRHLNIKLSSDDSHALPQRFHQRLFVLPARLYKENRKQMHCWTLAFTRVHKYNWIDFPHFATCRWTLIRFMFGISARKISKSFPTSTQKMDLYSSSLTDTTVAIFFISTAAALHNDLHALKKQSFLHFTSPSNVCAIKGKLIFSCFKKKPPRWYLLTIKIFGKSWKMKQLQVYLKLWIVVLSALTLKRLTAYVSLGKKA